MSTIILTLLKIGAEIFCYLSFFDTFLNKTDWLGQKYINQVYLFILLMIVPFFIIITFDNLWVRASSIIFLYSLVIHFFYKGNYLIKLGLSSIIYILVLGTDIFSLFLTDLLTSESQNLITEDNKCFILIAALSKTCLFFIVVTLQKITTHYLSKYKERSYYHWIVYLLMSLVSIISMLTLIELTYRIGDIYIISVIAILGLLFLNTIVFQLLERDHEFKINKRENALYKQQIKTELNNLKTLIQSFESQHTYLHDHKQQLKIINQLISKKDMQAAQNLITSLYNELYVSIYRFKTNHSIIDAILNQKFIEADTKNVILDIRADDLSKVQIELKYIVTILGNVIDNAIEAADQIGPNKIVSIKLTNQDNILIFSVINPVNHEVKIVDNKIFESSKMDKITHGQGLKNVAFALKKCNGDYEMACDKQQFQFTALIRL